MTDDYINKTNEKDGDDYLGEGERHIWDGKKSSPIPLALLGLGFFVMVFLFIVFLSKTTDIASKTEILNIEKRLALLEERLGKIVKIDEKLILLDTQGKKFELFVDRFDRFETSMSLKMDIINNELFTSQKKGNKVAESKKPEQIKISEIVVLMRGYAYAQNINQQMNLVEAFIDRLKINPSLQERLKELKLVDVTKEILQEFEVTFFKIRLKAEVDND